MTTEKDMEGVTRQERDALLSTAKGEPPVGLISSMIMKYIGLHLLMENKKEG